MGDNRTIGTYINSAVTLLVILLVAAAVVAAAGDNGKTNTGLPVFAIGVGMAFAIQWIAFVPAWLRHSERFFDITGTVTYIAVIGVSLVLSDAYNPRSLLISLLIFAWTIRLGGFLNRRINMSGRDSRFDVIKDSFSRFLSMWSLQGLWISLTLSAALLAITAKRPAKLDLFILFGCIAWLTGFVLETAADEQKRRHNATPENTGSFIKTGLWRWSRHPNYFGEILLWSGIAMIALPSLQGRGYVGLISPVFVYLLLRYISGVPILERKADEKWGKTDEYISYKSRMRLLVPFPRLTEPG